MPTVDIEINGPGLWVMFTSISLMNINNENPLKFNKELFFLNLYLNFSESLDDISLFPPSRPKNSQVTA